MGRRGAVCSPWVQAVCSQMSVHFYGGRLGPRHHYGSRCRLCPCCPAAQSCSTLATPWTVACQASLSFMISWSLLRFTSSESVMPCNHLILCHPLLLPSIFPSTGVFSSELALCITWPEYWSFSFSISPSIEAPLEPPPSPLWSNQPSSPGGKLIAMARPALPSPV